MLLRLTQDEKRAAMVALDCCQDNEHDKGDEGAGTEIADQVSALYDELITDAELVQAPLVVLGMLQSYLGAVEGVENFEGVFEGATAEALEHARAALLARLDALDLLTV